MLSGQYHSVISRRITARGDLGLKSAIATLSFFLLLPSSGCFLSQGQRYHDFRTSAPLPTQNLLILGFLGGREPWDSQHSGIRKLALRLRRMKLPGVSVETVENKKRDLAIRLIRRSLDLDGDGKTSQEEATRAGLILYGQSFGGAAVVKLARQLQAMSLPILLTIQIDSVGRGDSVIPGNVLRAANLFQQNGFLIRGESEIRAADPARTEIIGNFRFDYSSKDIDLSGVSWWKRFFAKDHARMNRDPEVWSHVEALILDTVKREAKLRPAGKGLVP